MLTAIKAAGLYGRFRTWRTLAKQRARDRYDDARAWRIEVGAVSPLRALAAAVLLGGGLWFAFGLHGWWVRREVNAEWRARIITASSGVRAAIARADAEADATDDDIIKALGETDEKQKAAERDLAAAGTSKPAAAPPADGDDPCRRCRIPAGGLRVR